MHPFQYLGLANARQAELIREAAEARLAADLPGRNRDVENGSGLRRRVLVAVATVLVGGVALLSAGVVPQDVLAAIRML